MGRRPAGVPDIGRGGRRLRRSADGRLFDMDERRPVTLEDLAEDVRAGRPFRAYRRHTGEECTNEVLLQVLRHVLPAYTGWADMGGATPPPEPPAEAAAERRSAPGRSLTRRREP